MSLSGMVKVVRKYFMSLVDSSVSLSVDKFSSPASTIKLNLNGLSGNILIPFTRTGEKLGVKFTILVAGKTLLIFWANEIRLPITVFKKKLIRITIEINR